MFKVLAVKDRHTQCIRCNYFGCEAGKRAYGHWIWAAKYYKRELKKRLNKLKPSYIYWKLFQQLDYSKISNVQVEGIDTRDYPDFCDAFIAYAEYKGKPMNDRQLDELSQDYDFVYEHIIATIY